jgi:hypothetical protein
MRKHWTILLLLVVIMPPVSPVGAEPAPEPLPKLSPREVGDLVKFFSRLLQLGVGTSEENLDRIETGTRDLARQRDAARREGIPLAPEEFQRPLPPAELNAASIYTKLTQLLKEKPIDEKAQNAATRLGSRYQHGPENVTTARKLLADRADVMALIHQATDRPKCVFQRDWSLGPELRFPEFSAARTAVRLITVESLLLARDGRYSEAITNQARGLRLAAHIAPDGTLIAYLVATACETLALYGMQEILYLSGPDARVAEQMRTAIGANRPSYSMRRALEGEVMLQIGAMNLCRRLGPQTIFMLAGKSQEEARKLATPFEQSQAGQRFWKLLADAGEADILGKMRRAFAIIQRPYPERKRLSQQWSDSITDRSMGVVGIFGAEVLPVMGLGGEKEMHVRALEDAVMTGAAVLTYKARHGEWPDRLEQAVSLPPIDPFTGQPLKYRRTEEGFVVYSLGASGRDDGGQIPPPGTRAEDWKSVFRYPAPPPRPYPTPEPEPPVAPNASPTEAVGA